jgi:hypothetical protein
MANPPAATTDPIRRHFNLKLVLQTLLTYFLHYSRFTQMKSIRTGETLSLTGVLENNRNVFSASRRLYG